MSKSSTASAPKTSQLSQKSAWAKGPPQTSSTAPTPRSQSPAPNANGPAAPTHSRRPSTLGQGVSFKDGVAGARSPPAITKTGSSVTFGSISDNAAPIQAPPASSASPTPASTVKAETVKSFGSVPTNSATTNGASPRPKVDIKKLFQGSGSGPSPTTATNGESSVGSPSSRPSPLPQTMPQTPGAPPSSSSQLGQHSYVPFVPTGLRPQQNGSNANGGGPPRSPVFPRQQMPNGNVNGRPGGQPGTPGPTQTALPSPRMGPPHGVQPAGMPPQGIPMQPWGQPYYYPYPGIHPDQMQYQWYAAPPPPHQVSSPHHPPPGPPGPPHSMPMSPRNAPPPLHPPSTPTLTPAVPHTGHPPHTTPSPHSHAASLSAVSSPPSTPSSSHAPRLNTNANAFIPRKITLKNPDGHELDLEALKKSTVAPAPAPLPSSPARKAQPIRIENPEAKKNRLAEEEKEKARKEAEERAKQEAEAKEKLKLEEEARKRAEEEDRKKKEEEERIRKEAEEKERIRLEEEERARKAEEERVKAEEEKQRLLKEEEERLRREEEERLAKEAEEKTKAIAKPESESVPAADQEEGEVEEKADADRQTADLAAQEESRDKVPDTKSSLRIDTAVIENAGPKRRPGPLDLSSAMNKPIAPPLPSALSTARRIEDIGSIEYPEGIRSPKVELNVDAKEGKFRYDRDFLLQFMAVCREKPDSLPPLDAIGLQPVEQDFNSITRTHSGRRSSSAQMPPPSSTASRQAGIGLGISGFSKSSNPFNMGNFATQGGKMNSDDRFQMSSGRSASIGGPTGLPFGRPVPMSRSSSQGGPGAPSGNNRTRSQRGGKRNEQNKSAAGPSGQSSMSYNQAMLAQAGLSLEPVAPLEQSANRWTPMSISKKPQAAESDSPEVVDRKVKALLNKLTMEKFDSISDQIIAWANKSEKETDGRTLIQVIRLVFEKATDEATWSEMYARLCRKMMDTISPKVQDEGIKNSEGKPFAGGQLFRKYLLNRCQEDFERGWVAKEATAAAAATKATEDQAAKDASKDEESALYSEEYYAAQKAKRQGLGLIKFIGELFKLQMLTERIMHECVKKLLGNVENPEEEEIESLCKLLSTVGQMLDTPKARAHMDVYFSRMKELCKSPNVNSRMQFMLQDVIELRDRKWIPRNQVAAPTTLAAVHDAAAKEKNHEKEAFNRNSMSRGGSRRGGERGDFQQVGPDGWAVAGNVPRPPPKAGDLSQFGKISKAAPMTFGPSSVFAGGKKETKSNRDSLTRTGSMNMFSMLNETTEAPTASKSSRPPSRKASVDFGTSGAPEAPPQRRKLMLQPRTLPKPEDKAESTPAASEAAESESEEPEAAAPATMTVEEAKARIDEDSKEFFSIRDLDEAEVYFTKLTVEHRHLLVDKLVSSAIEAKDADATLVANFLDRAVSKNLCSPASLEEGFMPVAEILDDIAIDAPKAYDLMAIMLKGAHLHEDQERIQRIASKSEDSDKLLSKLSS